MADSGNDRVQVGGKEITSLLGVFGVFQFCGVFLGSLSSCISVVDKTES